MNHKREIARLKMGCTIFVRMRAKIHNNNNVRKCAIIVVEFIRLFSYAPYVILDASKAQNYFKNIKAN